MNLERAGGRGGGGGGLEAKERKSQELAGVHAFGVRSRGSDGSTPRHTGLLVTIPGPWHPWHHHHQGSLYRKRRRGRTQLSTPAYR